MPVGAVLCLQCGYDTRTGTRVGEAGARKPSPLLVTGLIALIVGALAIVFLRSTSSPPTPQPAPAATPAEPSPGEVPPATDVPAAEQPVQEPDAEDQASAEPVATTETVETESAEPESAEPAPPPEPEIDWTAVEAAQRERAIAELDRRAPPFEPGEAVELRMANGFIHKGIFRGIDEERLTLEFATNDVRQLPLKEMDRATRLRAEPEYRARYLDYHLQQRMDELRRTQNNAPQATNR